MAAAPDSSATTGGDKTQLTAREIVLLPKGLPFDKTLFIGHGGEMTKKLLKDGIGDAVKAKEAEDIISYDPEPELFINKLIGIWSGDVGIDTVFVDPLENIKGAGNYETGFKTEYVESVTISNIAGNIINPRTLSKHEPAGVLDGSQKIFGVRYTRIITSKLGQEGGDDNPFVAPQPLHDETGYMLFSYVGKKKDDGSIKFKLSEIIHSFSIPRGMIVQAACDEDDVENDLNGGEFNGGKLKYSVTANELGLSSKVVPNSFLLKNGTGRVSSFSMKNTFNFKNENNDGNYEGSTWQYTQKSPFYFPLGNVFLSWEHDNSNVLIKNNKQIQLNQSKL